MAVATVGDLIAYAFRTSGINGQGQSPTADDANDALTTLQAMLAGWQRKRWLIWDLTETILISTGALNYTIGPAGNFNVARPDRIESAFARYLPSISGTYSNNGGVLMVTGGSLPTSPTGLSPGAYWNNGGVVMVVPGSVTLGSTFVDYPLGIIESREAYNDIALKGFSSVPNGVFYDSAWPTGNLYFWPIPPANQYELHVFSKTTLPAYTTLTTPLNMPPEYLEAIKYALVVRLTMDWGLDPKPAHIGAMRAAMALVRIANAQPPELHMPSGLAGRRYGTNMAGFISGRW